MEKTIHRRSVGKIDKMQIFLGKVKKWKKQTVEGLWVKLTKFGNVKKWKKNNL